MRKILLTGCSGFVARHYLDLLKDNNEDVKVLGVDIKPPAFVDRDFSDIFEYRSLNLLEKDEVEKLILNFGPTDVLHLAAFSSVKYSWEYPAECFQNNTSVFLSVVEAVRKLNGITGKSCRILSVGSSEIYGDVKEDMIPLKEDMEIHPLNPYAIAREAQEALSKVYAEHFDVDIILTRSFNHMGPGQDSRFVIPGFLDRIMALRLPLEGKGDRETVDEVVSGTIETGDVSIIRDFLDVRDVVRAYDILLKQGKPGEIYNICKGEGVSLREVIDVMGNLLNIKVTPEVNPEFVRPDDNHIIIGSPDKIFKDTGWKAEIPLEKTIQDMITERR
ncbi:MAG: GDP-mannose 4,6-dehydratase [Lachnospiraceae bacterium]|nr:GDP-mannose 4,6-dehydratase [Lachnospiraceae bacterium]